MRWSDAKTILWQAALFAVLALTLTSQSALSAGDVDPSRLRGADTEPQNWFTLGRDQNQTYYSPLAEIDASNVGRLGFAWAYDLGTARGQEATPIVIDGTMYTSGTWGYVYALDAATGEELWKFDPRADPRAARNPCCDLVNRGVAVWEGKVFVASVDGRLHALDAKTGTDVEAKIESHPDAIVALLRKLGLSIERAGLEAGPLSQWLHSGLSKGGFETVLLETRHVKAALSAHAPGSAVSSSRPTLLAHPSAGRANWARWPLSGLRTNPSPVKRGAACADSRSPSPRISVPWVSPRF